MMNNANDFTYSERWTHNSGVRINWLDSLPSSDPRFVPLFYIPGALGSAEQFIDEMRVLQPRRCVSISIRGRGRSDTPERGYSFDQQLNDVVKVAHDAALSQCVVMAHSMGVPFALGFALARSSMVRGLILLDFPARIRPYPADVSERLMRELPDRARPALMRGLLSELEDVELWEQLSPDYS